MSQTQRIMGTILLTSVLLGFVIQSQNEESHGWESSGGNESPMEQDMVELTSEVARLQDTITHQDIEIRRLTKLTKLTKRTKPTECGPKLESPAIDAGTDAEKPDRPLDGESDTSVSATQTAL